MLLEKTMKQEYIENENLNEYFIKNVESLNKLRNKIKEEVLLAIKAKEAAEKAVSLSVKHSNNTIIQKLQTAVECLAKANIASVEISKDIVIFQNQLSNFTRQLFLFVTTDTINRGEIIEKLNLLIKKGTTEKLDDYTKNQIESMIEYLNDQQNHINKLNKFNSVLNEQAQKINKISIKNKVLVRFNFFILILNIFLLIKFFI